MKQSIFTVTIFLSLISFPSAAQTGFDDLDTSLWTKTDTVEFKSNYIFLVFYSDSSIQKIRVDMIGNSSWTGVFYVENNLLSNVVIVQDDPGGYERRYTEKYSFSNGRMTSWTDVMGNEQANQDSETYETEETRILAMFGDYFEKAKTHNSKVD